ncbi:MAG: type II toxin-antitoxin system RelE/ParE family toxin [Pirellulales bacterium]
MNVYWTEAALADLRAVQAYIARHSPRYADAMVQRIIGRTDSLSQHPLIGAVVPEYDAEVLREILEDPYRIIYRVLPKQIDIIAVIHAARAMPPDLPGVAK